MTAALVTATVLGIGGLVYVTVLGFLASAPEQISQHVTFAIFFTFITLLAHSMTMFYLIGKGKAIREAVTDGGLSDELHLAVARARRPVFSTGTLAMALTMLAAILGGGVDTDVLPVVVHSLPGRPGVRHQPPGVSRRAGRTGDRGGFGGRGQPVARVTRLLLFDIDGTLLLSGGAGTRALNRTFEEMFGVAGAFTGIAVAGRTDPLILGDALDRAGVAADAGARRRFFARYCGHFEREILLPGPRKGLMPGGAAPARPVAGAAGRGLCAADRQHRAGGTHQAGALCAPALLHVRGLRRRCAAA